MNKGYLLFAIDNPVYAKLAYACALSIKNTQAVCNNVTVVTNTLDAFSDYKNIFDEIVVYSGPGGMDARVRAYDYTPYNETVLLDADLLFLKPMDHYWDMMKNRDLFITNAPQTYNGKQFKYGYYRRTMQEHKLPDIYNAWTYFKKESDLAKEFFTLAKEITDNSSVYLNTILTGTAYKSIPTDEAFALALCILDKVNEVVPGWDFPRITHMKPAVQQWKESVPDWADKLRFTIDQDLSVKLGVWQQSDLLHYVKKDLITDEILLLLEQKLML
jgi:hypothetical protein